MENVEAVQPPPGSRPKATIPTLEQRLQDPQEAQPMLLGMFSLIDESA